MAIIKRFFRGIAGICIAAIFTVIFVACGNKVISSGYTWTVTENIKLTSLAIAEGASVRAPMGYKLIMTVDGVEKPIKAGAYRGEIVLTVSKNI